MIRKSFYYEFFKGLDRKIREDVLKRVDELIIEEGEYCDKGNFKHLSDIFSTIALYESLNMHGFEKDEAYEMVSNALYKAVGPIKKRMESLSKRKLFWRFIKVILPIAFRRGSGIGWRFTWFQKLPENICKFEVNECIYQKIFKKKNLEFLGPMLCKCDVIMYGNLPDIDFQREGTLCYGDSVCDFKFVRYPKNTLFERSNSR